ncbi:uncharacterized protein Eint_081405 [Encephalitozoon intestinalis ATCC 50506]|uniref:Uncharacterized protein n=1 Tax=Encephalitozoon intestinalis (strain ATCC 50506) TaxID=876142 RepID=W8P9C6_ENCIT|nr:uncharacterized protein Eint_081405 [Encephalitozoon intestinalis ATCC 50506]AHL30142.1 hypothetical protein Eint_081405 [Encephalitozoon intestinalis ATCC 50506]UTX45863.1 telomere length regulation protein TEN1 [Encephalitozoon intestinalis]
MLSLLDRPIEGKTIYSFGKVESRLGSGRYKVVFKERSIIMATEKQLDIGSWVRMYGMFRSGILRTIFVGGLSGVDINVLERAIEYVKQHL